MSGMCRRTRSHSFMSGSDITSARWTVPAAQRARRPRDMAADGPELDPLRNETSFVRLIERCSFRDSGAAKNHFTSMSAFPVERFTCERRKTSEVPVDLPRPPLLPLRSMAAIVRAAT